MLVISFSLVAALTIIVGAWTISRTISEYLAGAMDERVARDMQLALSDYDLMLREIAGTTLRLSRDPTLGENLGKIRQGDPDALKNIDQQLAVKFIGSALGGNRLIAVIDQDGDLLAGQLLSTEGVLSKVNPSDGWQNLEIIQKAMSSGQSQAATEVIAAEQLAKVGLEEQARIPILDTPKAAPELYDAREGTAGLALASASPIWDEQKKVVGAVLAMHLFNNDFTLVDRIKTMAGIDTATIFLGDLRVFYKRDDPGWRARHRHTAVGRGQRCRSQPGQ